MVSKLLLNTWMIWMIFFKILIVFDDMISDMLNNKRHNPIVAELFIRGRKLNVSLVFIMQYCFVVPKNISLISAHYLIMNIPSKQGLQKISLNHSSDIDFQDFMNFCKKCTAKPYWCYFCIR